MKNKEDRKLVGRLIYRVLTQQINVREAIKVFPDTKDKSIECAYHALVHYAADDNIRYKDIEYKDAQDEYLEYIAQTLNSGNPLPQNIINEYKPYYSGISHPWLNDIRGFWKEFSRFINIK